MLLGCVLSMLSVEVKLGWILAELLGGEVIFCQGGEGSSSPRICNRLMLERSGTFKETLCKF